MPEVNVSTGENTLIVTGWQLESSAVIRIEIRRAFTDAELAELARLMRINADLLIKLALAKAV